ncbi:hypothetical protein QJS10_CPA03g01169 [Acorus calamus]|uniref:Uncharacterized protein n=1 Tax=Acorus calamus TaxID=4465 RepID=A0AAV9F4E8_ACOCL|nr:hypothetical protein QJS10_CPA03g01169 [Acorus calamus]
MGGGEEGVRGTEEEKLARVRQRFVLNVLGVGIVFRSVIIGVTMGMSQNVCTLRPLVAALTFHQIFGGMVAGGYIAQAISSKPWLKKASYTALVIGSASMSVLALWS